MPKTYNSAGDTTHQMAAGRRRSLLLWGFLGIAVLIVFFIISLDPKKFGMGGIGILVLLIAMRMVVNIFDSYSRRQEKKIRRADRGAVAEEKIGDLLDGLSDDFEVLHDVDSPYGNIDHLVISRQGGIFLLETKSHRGTITTTDSKILLNGHQPEKDFVAQALKNSYWVRDEAERVIQQKPWITAVVVFTNAFVIARQPIKGVRVTNKKYLLEILQKPASANAVNALVWKKREALVASLLEEAFELRPFVNDNVANFCPKCGAELVRKTVKSGAQAGKVFMVCQKYPECKTATAIINSLR
jgi:restriction system protein